MALKHLVDLDLGGNEIQNVVLQNLGTAPTGSEGQIYYDTAANCVKVHTGSGFVRVGLTADGSTITETNGEISVGTIAISNVTNLQSSLDGKVDDSQVLTNVPAGAVFTDTVYSVGDGGLTEVNFTSEFATKLTDIQDGATATHAPAIRDNNGTPALVTGITAQEVRSLIGAGTSSFNGAYSSLTGIPATFAPSAHNHDVSEVDGLQDALDAKFNAADIAGYATETYVDTAVSGLVDAAPGALNTLNELAAAIGDDANFSTTITNQIGAKLDSSAYTAADVLAKIKTVDGAGSGLNADLLDGNSSAHYLNYNNLNNKPAVPALAIINVTGEATPVTVPLAPVASKAIVQVYETATMSLVMTEITQVTDGQAVIALNDGVDYTVIATGRQ